MSIVRPPRTEAHRQRDTYLQQFADRGLVPILSTNGGEPDADIEIIKGDKPGDVRECWVKPWGERRLAFARGVAEGRAVITEVTRVQG